MDRNLFHYHCLIEVRGFNILLQTNVNDRAVPSIQVVVASLVFSFARGYCVSLFQCCVTIPLSCWDKMILHFLFYDHNDHIHILAFSGYVIVILLFSKIYLQQSLKIEIYSTALWLQIQYVTQSTS